jgi:stage II sporulation protein D
MKRALQHGATLAALALAALLAGCQDSSIEETPLVHPPVPAPPPAVPSRNARPVEPPETPIRLEKPRVLGPLTPALVAVPDRMAEPSIRIKLTDEQDRPPVVRRGAYRGRVDIVKVPGPNGRVRYAAVNTVPIESYLQGVLAKEMYGSWDPEAFASQAIAARTFALYSLKTQAMTSPDKLWDVSDDEGSQMYGGIAGETAKSRAAVAATRGQVLVMVRNGTPAIFCSRYSACSGGASQDPLDAWSDTTVPALSARVLGPVDQNCPKYQWPAMPVSKADITRCMRSWGERNGFSHLLRLGPIQSVVIGKRNAVTGRPTVLTLTDTAGHTAPIHAEEFRIALLTDPAGSAPKPPSSFFEIRDQGNAIVLVNGHGYGHGIGLSQWGAQALALQGRTHNQILAFYYPGAALHDLW